MPKLHAVIHEQVTHILNPVAVQLVRKLLTITGCPNNFKNNIILKTGDTGVSDRTDGEHNANLVSDTCEVEFTPSLSPTNAKWDIMNFSNSPAYGSTVNRKFASQLVFADQISKVFMSEQLMPCTLNMKINLIFKSMEEAYSTHMRIFNMFHDGSIITENDIVYDYAVPNEIMTFLRSLFQYKKWENVDKLPTFEQYFNIGTFGKGSILTARSKHDVSEFIIQKAMVKTLCSCTYNQEKPEATTVGQATESYSLNIDYIAQFTRADSLTLHFPIIVDNQELSINMMPILKNYDLTNPSINVVERAFASYYDAYNKKFIGTLAHPFYDDWHIPWKAHMRSLTYQPIFQAAFTLDEDKEYTEIDLKSVIGRYKFNKFVISEMEKAGSSTLELEHLFHVGIYADDGVIGTMFKTITLTSDLKLRVHAKDMRKMYHIFLAESDRIKRLYISLGEYPDYNDPNFDYDADIKDWPMLDPNDIGIPPHDLIGHPDIDIDGDDLTINGVRYGNSNGKRVFLFDFTCLRVE